MPELAPALCPFCGSESALQGVETLGVPTIRRYRVGCTGCGATGPEGVTQPEAIAGWNKRRIPMTTTWEVMATQLGQTSLVRHPATPAPGRTVIGYVSAPRLGSPISATRLISPVETRQFPSTRDAQTWLEQVAQETSDPSYLMHRRAVILEPQSGLIPEDTEGTIVEVYTDAYNLVAVGFEVEVRDTLGRTHVLTLQADAVGVLSDDPS